MKNTHDTRTIKLEQIVQSRGHSIDEFQLNRFQINHNELYALRTLSFFTYN